MGERDFAFFFYFFYVCPSLLPLVDKTAFYMRSFRQVTLLFPLTNNIQGHSSLLHACRPLSWNAFPHTGLCMLSPLTASCNASLKITFKATIFCNMHADSIFSALLLIGLHVLLSPPGVITPWKLPVNIVHSYESLPGLVTCLRASCKSACGVPGRSSHWRLWRQEPRPHTCSNLSGNIPKHVGAQPQTLARLSWISWHIH